MKRIIVIASLLLCLATPIFAQDDETEVVLPDPVMKQVVRRLVTFYFKPRRSPTTIYFSDENIKQEWMPKINNIRFVLIPSGEYNNGLRGYTITNIDRSDSGYSVGFGYGDIGCGGGYGVTWSIRVAGTKVSLRRSRYGFGWACHSSGSNRK